MTVGEGRQRLDKTLASNALTDKASVRNIVYGQLLRSACVVPDGKESSVWTEFAKPSIEATDRYSAEVWNFLEALRSTSGDEIGKLPVSDDSSDTGWKLKEETSRFRVMYKPGSEGTPFHTLCLEGILEGQIVNSLCVAWEAPLFREWWPQFAVPSFKIVESKWVRRIRVGEDLAMVRLKVPWPFATREILFSLFEVEYFQENLVMVLLHSVPAMDDIEGKTFGFSNSDLPSAPHSVVRMDLAGGFVIQRISPTVSYFRTIMNLDMKLDFVPPWIINFMSRQLAGQGYKLFQKAVLQVENGKSGKAFEQLAKTEPLYVRVREGFDLAEKYEYGTLTVASEKVTLPKETARDKGKCLQGGLRKLGSENYRVAPCPEVEEIVDATGITIPKPDDSARNDTLPSNSMAMPVPDANSSSPPVPVYDVADPEVQWALEVLDKTIAYLKKNGLGSLPCLQPPREASHNVASQPSVKSEEESPSETSKPDCEVIVGRKSVAGVSNLDTLVESSRSEPVNEVIIPPPVQRAASVRQVSPSLHRERRWARWSMFRCMPARIRRPPLDMGSPVTDSALFLAESQHLAISAESWQMGEEVVSLGELLAREKLRK